MQNTPNDKLENSEINTSVDSIFSTQPQGDSPPFEKTEYEFKQKIINFPSYIPPGDFPWQELPETIKGAVVEICQNDSLAVPLAVQATLSAVSLACQDLILVDRGIGEPSPCSLFMLAVAESGSRKTTADKIITKPLEEYDKERKHEFNEISITYKNDLKKYKNKENVLTKIFESWLKKKHGDHEENIDYINEKINEIENELTEIRLTTATLIQPKLRRVLYSSISIKDLEGNLCKNWPSAGLISNEAADILNSRSESDMARLDRLWDGQSIDVIGKTKNESYFVSDPRLTLSLMIQPTVFERFIERKGDIARGIGFFPRTLISQPETLYGQRTINESTTRATEWIEKFNARVLQLLNYNHADINNRKSKRIVLSFSPSARLIWKEDHNAKELMTIDGGPYSDEREFINRYSEHVARIAALFHFFENGIVQDDQYPTNYKKDEISESTVKSAIKIAEWYLNEYSQVFNPEKSISTAGKYVFEMILRYFSTTYGVKPSEVVKLPYSDLEKGIKENDLRLRCSRYGLKSNTLRFKQVLEWMDAKKMITRTSKNLNSAKIKTAVVTVNPYGLNQYHKFYGTDY
ncbi:YfjI family protein [Aquitalea pelogenes]|uniref:YfjI family protein n=1 Tax=Aquitalea pelogenes TaxID=1293573 RepID=UPI0035B32B3A